MVILMDTREQAGLEFPTDSILTAVERCTLSVGDYACRFLDGTMPPVRFERKSIPDLFGTLTGGYARFKREVERAQSEQLMLILIIESPLLTVLDSHSYSSFSGPSMVQKLFTLMIRHKLPVIFCRNREDMALYIRNYFEAIGREYIALKRLLLVGTV